MSKIVELLLTKKPKDSQANTKGIDKTPIGIEQPFQNSKDLTLISTNSGDLGNTHSEYFNALSEMGIFGLISWLAVFLSSLALGLKIVYQIKRPAWQRSLTTALLLGLITYYVHAFLNNYSDFDKIAAPLWGFMAIMVAISFYWPYNKENVEKLTNLIE